MLTGTSDELLISLLSSGPSRFLVACLGLSCPGGVPVTHWQSVNSGCRRAARTRNPARTIPVSLHDPTNIRTCRASRRKPARPTEKTTYSNEVDLPGQLQLDTGVLRAERTLF